MIHISFVRYLGAMFLAPLVTVCACLPAWEDRWWVDDDDAGGAGGWADDDDDGGGGTPQWIETRLCISHPSGAGSSWSGICTVGCAGDQDCPAFELSAGGSSCGSCGWANTLPAANSETILACDVAGNIDAEELRHPCNSGSDCAGLSQQSGASAGCY